MKKFLPYLSVIVAMLIWSVSGIAIKQALLSFSTLTLIVLRFTVAVLLMLAVGLVCRRSTMLRLQRIEWKHVPLFALASLFQPCLYYILETMSYAKLASPTIAEALLSTSPIVAPLCAFLLLREKITRYNIYGILVSTAGMLMLVLCGAGQFSIGDMMGVPVAMAAVVTAVLYTVVLRRIPSQYNPLSIVFYIQLFSLLFFYPLWAMVDGWHNPFVGITMAEILPALCSVGYLAVFASVTAFILFCYTVRQIGVTKTNIFNNIRPVFTALFMLLLYHEHLPWLKLVGIVLVIAGLFLAQKVENGGMSVSK